MLNTMVKHWRDGDWGNLVIRVDSLGAYANTQREIKFPLIPRGTELHQQIRKFLDMMKEINMNFDSLSNEALMTLENAITSLRSGSGLFIDKKKMEGVQKSLKDIRDKIKPEIPRLIAMAEQFLAFAEGSRPIPIGIAQVLQNFTSIVQPAMGSISPQPYAVSSTVHSNNPTDTVETVYNSSTNTSQNGNTTPPPPSLNGYGPSEQQLQQQLLLQQQNQLFQQQQQQKQQQELLQQLQHTPPSPLGINTRNPTAKATEKKENKLRDAADTVKKVALNLETTARKESKGETEQQAKAVAAEKAQQAAAAAAETLKTAAVNAQTTAAAAAAKLKKAAAAETAKLKKEAEEKAQQAAAAAAAKLKTVAADKAQQAAAVAARLVIAAAKRTPAGFAAVTAVKAGTALAPYAGRAVQSATRRT